MQRNYVTIRPLNREDSDDPLDRDIDLGASLQPHAPPTPAAESPNRPWPIVAIFMVFAVLAALSVGFFLRAPRPTPVPEKKGVEETIVELPSSAPPVPNASASATPAPIATADKPEPKVSQPGRLLIRSTPADADVIVNGTPRGKTPLALRDLALGSYTIRVARDGYVAEERTLRLTASRPAATATINLRDEKTGPGLLNVRSRPAGARVYVNDRLAGKTPISIPSLPAGPATVRIEMDGYRVWSTKVHVNAGEQTRVAASLERR